MARQARLAVSFVEKSPHIVEVALSLANFIAELDQLATAGKSAFDSAADAASVETARVEFLGAKSGKLKAAQKGLGTVPGPDKPAAAKRFNEVKTTLEAALAAAQERLAGATSEATEPFDITLPGRRPIIGHLHPITQTIEELKDIMGRLGFTVADG